jgi:hypothetical protein
MNNLIRAIYTYYMKSPLCAYPRQNQRRVCAPRFEIIKHILYMIIILNLNLSHKTDHQHIVRLQICLKFKDKIPCFTCKNSSASGDFAP